MPLFGSPAPDRHRPHPDEIGPDIVFVISGASDGSNPLGWFCSAGATPIQYGALQFAANADTWVWTTASGANDAAWPQATFYLVPAPSTPPAQFPATLGPVSYTSGSFPSQLGAGTSAPDSSQPYYLFTNQQPNGPQALGYVQRIGQTRTWFESAAPWSTDGGPTVIPVSAWLSFSLVPPGTAGNGGRMTLTTTRV